MQYRDTAIFSDLDGTLFDKHGLVGEQNRRAIRAYTEAGGLFAIATGRSYFNAKKNLPDVDINAPCIVFNGSGVYDPETDSYPFSVHVDHEAVLSVLLWCRENLPGLDTQVYGERMTYYVTPRESANRELVRQLEPCEFTSIEAVAHLPWFKTLHYGKPEETKALDDYLSASGLSERVAIVRAMTEIQPYYEHIELLPKDVNKGRALDACRALPLFSGRTLFGIGDYKNDLELLERADVPCCPENACPEAKALSAHIVRPHTDNAIASLIFDLIPRL